MKPETEHTIQQAFNSLEVLKKAAAPAGFTQTVLHKLENATPVKLIPMRKIWTAAAAVALLLVVNIWAVSSLEPAEKAHNNKSEGEQLVKEYGLDI